MADPPSIEDVKPNPQVITRCTQPNTIAITFDDGPSIYTATLLDQLQQLQFHVTFFMNGNNSVDASQPQYQAILKRIVDEGHQLASHTLTHMDLSTATDAQVGQEMHSNEHIIYTATGRIPRYMRPPYGNVTPHTVQLLQGMGYRIVNWSADTKDYESNNADISFGLYQKIVQQGTSGLIVLDHDIVKSSATQLMPRVVALIRQTGWRMVTVAECMGDPLGAYQ